MIMLHNTLLLLLTFAILSVSVTGIPTLATYNVKTILLPKLAIVLRVMLTVVLVVAKRETRNLTRRYARLS
jgi:photosystem II stability/assembly factor-like uncharacterized protein